MRFLNTLAFIALLASTAVGLHSLWGVLFLFWTIRNLRTGETFILSTVRRQETPILYWLIQITWLLLALMMIASDFNYVLIEIPEMMEV